MGVLELDEYKRSAINEVGNLCMAGGVNHIARFAEETVDMSIVSAEVTDSQDLLLELNLDDECKVFLMQEIVGDLPAHFLFRVSSDLVPNILNKFSNLPSLKLEKTLEDSLLELVNIFCSGSTNGLISMTQWDLRAKSQVKFIRDLDDVRLSEKVFRYNAEITVANERIDFSVFLFADADQLITKVLSSLGLVQEYENG